MNRSLRRTHFRLVALLAPVAAVTLALSIAARRSAPENSTPAFLRTPAPLPLQPAERRLIRADRLAVELRQLGDSIELQAIDDPRVADLLIYLGSGDGSTLPSDASLLGPLAGTAPARWILPRATGPRSLYLYSGATDTVLAHVKLTGESP